jgi:hypothetical protein
MTVCPIAIVSGCNKCPVFRICPLKTVLGDYRPKQDQTSAGKADAAKATKDARKPKR